MIQLYILSVYHLKGDLSRRHSLDFLHLGGYNSFRNGSETMKKLLALLCAAILLLSTACAAPQPPQTTTAPGATTNPIQTDPPVTDPPVTEPPTTRPDTHELFDAITCATLLGTWSTTVTLDGSLLYLPSFEESTSFTLYYSFDVYGQFSAFVDEAEFETVLSTYEKLIIDHMVHMQYLTFKGRHEYTNTPEEIDAMWVDGPQAQAQTDSEDFVASLNLYYRCMKLVRQGQYYSLDGKLYTQLDEGVFECNTYTVTDGTLSLTTTDNMTVYRPLGLVFPIDFTQN